MAGSASQIVGLVEFQLEKTKDLRRLKRKAKRIINYETTKDYSGTGGGVLP